MSRLHEFLEVQSVYAIRNLTVLITVLVGSVVVIKMTIMAQLTSEIFGIYMFAGGGVYGFGKWQDERTKRNQIDADADPAIVPQSVVTVNQPEISNVSKDGEVTVKKRRK